MDITNLGSMAANVQMTADTSEVERAITNMTAQANRQFSELGNKTLTDLTNNFRGFTSVVTGGIDAINASISKVQQVASLGFLGAGLGNIVGQIYQTRQFFQDTESTMNTFFKSAEKSKEFVSDLKDYAYKNMFEFSDLVTVSKQLIAYGTTETEDIIRVTDQLSNIATGTGANINEMVGIYNKIKATGKANGLVLQQLASRGLVVKDVLKEMGETVNGSTITFKQFEKVLQHVTDEGGMFHNQMENQMQNLSASYGQLQDDLTAMYAEMGEALEPVFKEAIDFADMLVGEYQETAAVLFDLVKAYGIYKVVASAQSWNEKSKADDQAIRLKAEKEALEEAAEATKQLADEDLRAAVKKGELTEAEAAEVAALRKKIAEENKARVSKGELTKEEAKQLAAIQEGLKLREIELEKTKKQAEEELEATSKEIEALNNKIAAQQEAARVAASYAKYGAAGQTRAETEALKLNELEAKKDQLAKAQLAAQERATAAATQINTIQTARNTAETQKNAQTTSLMTRARAAAGAALKGIGSQIASLINPTALLTSAIGFLATQCWEAYQAGDAYNQAMDRMREQQDKAMEGIGSELYKLGELSQTIKSAAEDSNEYANAKAQLLEMTKQYNVETTETINGMQSEMSAVDILTNKYEELKNKIIETYNYKAYQAFVSGEQENINTQMVSSTSLLREQMLNALTKDLDPEEKGAMSARISAAVAEIGAQMVAGGVEINKETGRLSGKNLSLETMRLLEQYREQMGNLDYVKNTFKGAWKSLMTTMSGDMSSDELKMFQSESMMQRVLGFGNLDPRKFADMTIYMAQKSIDASNRAIVDSRKAFNVYQEKEKEDQSTQTTPKDQTKYKTKLEKEKGAEQKYIEEYAKLVEERRKEIKKIDEAFENEEVRNFKTERIKEMYGNKFSALFNNSALSEDVKKALQQEYENANNAEYEIAKKGAEQLQKDITALREKQKRVMSQKLEKNAEGNAPTTEEQQQFAEKQTAEYNNIEKQIAAKQAALRGFEDSLNRYFEIDNYSKKAAAYQKFAEEYMQTFVNIEEKQWETDKKLKELGKEAQKAKTNEQKADIQMQIDNANKEMELYKKEQESKRNILVSEFNGAAEDITDVITEMTQDAAKLSFDAILKRVEELKAKIVRLNAQKEMGVDVSKDLAETSAELIRLEFLAKKAKEATQKQKGDKLDYWTDSKKAIEQLASAFRDLGNEIGGSTKEALDTAATIMTTTTNIIQGIVTFTTTSIEGIKTATTAAAKALKTIEAASVILAVASAVLQLIHSVSSLFNAKDPVDEMRDSLHEFNLEVEETKRLAAQDLTFKPFDTIFGSDQWGTMLNNIRIGQEALVKYNETVEDTIRGAHTLAENYGEHGRGTANTTNWLGISTKETVTNQYDNIEDTISNMYIKLKHKTWFTSEKGTTLGEMVPSLFGADGKLDKNALHEFVEAGNDAFENLSTENQDYLREMDKSWQEYQKSVQEVRDTFKDFFGNLGAEIQDVWTNAFRTGQDGLADFEKSWDSAIENMITSMAYNKTIGKLMSQMENDLDRVGFFENPEGNMREAIDIMELYEQRSKKTQSAYDAILQQYRDKGYFQDESAAEERKAVSGGITNMTQDTAEELNGRMTQIQSHTFGILENQKLMVSMQTTQLTILQGIHSDTVGIRSDIAELKATVSDIQIKGLKMK